MSQWKHLYNSKAWKQRRTAQLDREPFCRRCDELGQVTAANVADHIEPHRGDPNKFYIGALQSLCEHCHNSYKQKFEKSGTVSGCDESGCPIDPNHHWNRTQVGGGQKSKT